MNFEKILLTEEGLNEFKEEIDSLKKKLNIIQSEKSEAYAGAIGDGWHDNFAYEDAKRHEDTVVAQINSLVQQSNYIEIINKITCDSNIVNLNDLIELKFIYDDMSEDIDCFRITGNWKSKCFDDYQEITLNSPLGKAVYLKKIGSNVQYSVNNKTINVMILRKIG